MIVTIELSEDQAAVLKVLAEAAGLTVERWLGQIAAQLARHPLLQLVFVLTGGESDRVIVGVVSRRATTEPAAPGRTTM